MHSSCGDNPGASAGQYQTNVYTKKRRKLKISLELAGEKIWGRAEQPLVGGAVPVYGSR
jgi:hypothetical protein